MLRLFDKDECPFCWKVRIALAYTDTDYEHILLGLGDDRSVLDQLSPTGTMPVLVDGDHAIWESAVIVEYINDLFEGALLPRSSIERSQARFLHSYSDTQIGPHLREVIFEKRAKPMAAWDLERIAYGEAGWRSCLDWLEAALRGGDFFTGLFSLAECALYPRFALAEHYGVGVDRHHPALFKWYAALRDTPSCNETRPQAWREG